MDNRLILGTAQLGMRYGIANRSGQPDFRTAEAIVMMAWHGGIREFDTAQAYGASEEILGRVLAKHRLNGEASITTKLSPDVDHLSRRSVFKAVERSLKTLGVSKLHNLMLHREHLLDMWQAGIGDNMNALLDSGIVKNIGISVYSPVSTVKALAIDKVSVIQIPSNVLDRRFEDIGIFSNVRWPEKQIYVRSIFLQGLLLMNSDTLDPDMRFVRRFLDTFTTLADTYGISNLEFALGYAHAAYPQAKIVVGAESCEQLEEILAVWPPQCPNGLVKAVKETFSDVDETVVNPAGWPKRSGRQ